VKVRFAVSAASGALYPDQLGSVVRQAEAAGFDTLWFSDVPTLPTTDPLLGVAFAAALTRRVKLGVNLIPFGHQPFVFARQVAQLDQLCSGRLLVTLVPGLDLPGERAGLGVSGRDRGRLLDAVVPQLRRWWAGQDVEVDGVAVALPVRPRQDPLEIWLGGSGPGAVRRAGRLADGWLGSLVSPDRAGAIRAAIEEEAGAAGRSIDPEHFGLSIAYARSPGDIGRAVRLRRARLSPASGTEDLSELVPVGRDALRSLVARLVEHGLSKFVVRPVAPLALEPPGSARESERSATAWSDELAWLTDALLDLQT
jgi:probable F420-dependent oxidoreductase